MRACWAGSVQGFHACKAALLHKSLKKKEYWSQKNESLDTFTPDALLSALGIDRDRRFAPHVPPGCPAVRADRTLLEAILFNATQNAALHGAAQHPIAVRCSVDEAGATSTLTVEIENAAGPNHSKPSTTASPSASTTSSRPTSGATCGAPASATASPPSSVSRI